MRHLEDKQLRDFEINQWFYVLQKQYLKEGKTIEEATNQAYEDIGLRFCLKKESVRRYKNAGLRPKNKRHLMIDVKANLQALKQIILKIEQSLNEYN